jgi:hypothetical protein
MGLPPPPKSTLLIRKITTAHSYEVANTTKLRVSQLVYGSSVDIVVPVSLMRLFSQKPEYQRLKQQYPRCPEAKECLQPQHTNFFDLL